MKLLQVIYELYHSEIAWLQEHENSNLHAIDREVRLCFADSPSIWLSWSSEPHNFCVSYSLKPHFVGQIDVIFDMTHSLMWKRLIGKDIILKYREKDHTLLEISDGMDSVWCWAEGLLGSDVLYISTQLQGDIP